MSDSARIGARWPPSWDPSKRSSAGRSTRERACEGAFTIASAAASNRTRRIDERAMLTPSGSEAAAKGPRDKYLMSNDPPHVAQAFPPPLAVDRRRAPARRAEAQRAKAGRPAMARQKMVEIEAAAQSSTRVGRIPR